jgi:hypothetical protein
MTSAVRTAPVRLTTKAEAFAQQAHEWVSFDDPESCRHWVFDVTFLLSHWTCIFGNGCQGVLTGPTPELEQGCCSYGAHLTDRDDEARVERAARELSDEQWQFASRGRARGVIKHTRSGEAVTRQADGACIFLNRPDFEGGAGCALHRAALDSGRRPLELKPDVCWQLPLRRDDTDDEGDWITTRIGQWERRHWGTGGQDFHWWCTDSPEAFVGAEPVYRTLREELVEMVGAEVYALLVSHLESRSDGGRPLQAPGLTDPGGQRVRA